MNTNSRLFDIRNKINDMEALRKQIQKPDSRIECQHIIKLILEQQRQKFLKVIDIIKKCTKYSLFQLKVNQNTLLEEMCRSGTAQEISYILKLEDLKGLDHQKSKQLPYLILENTQRKNERNEALQIFRVLISHEPKLLANSQSKLLVQAIQRQQFQIAEFLALNGTNVHHVSPDRDTLLHILMKNYQKKHQKQIMSLRSVLISKGVDEKLSNVNGKKSYQLCSAEVGKKIMQEIKAQSNQRRLKGDDSMRNKGKSQQGSYFSRSQNIQYRQKNESSSLIRIENSEDLCRAADSCLQKRTKQKQKQFTQKQKIVEKSRQKKQRLYKKVLTPQQLKPFLNKQIQLFIEQVQRQNQDQKSLLNQLIEKITKKINQHVGASVKIFGSFATQLCLYQSDIDMVVIPTQSTQFETSFKLLQSISVLLETMSQQVQTVKYIKTASVPIIKIQCSKKYRSKKIDITFKDQNHNGLESVQLILKYISINPQLRPLVFVLKKFIYCTNIYDPYSGGLSSYGLILMIVAYLQNQNRQRKMRGGQDFNKSPTIAELLIGFLYYYGFKCNYISKKICILVPEKAKEQMQATYIDKHSQNPIYKEAMEIQQMMYPNDWQPRAKLMIEDPLNPNNNIGRATHKIRQIKTAFEMAYVCIHTVKNCRSKKNCQYYKRIMSLNLKQTNYKTPCCILKRMLNSTKSFMAV